MIPHWVWINSLNHYTFSFYRQTFATNITSVQCRWTDTIIVAKTENLYSIRIANIIVFISMVASSSWHTEIHSLMCERLETQKDQHTNDWNTKSFPIMLLSWTGHRKQVPSKTLATLPRSWIEQLSGLLHVVLLQHQMNIHNLIKSLSTRAATTHSSIHSDT